MVQEGGVEVEVDGEWVNEYIVVFFGFRSFECFKVRMWRKEFLGGD